ncbi:MAG: TRAP-type C4-dicarboxylate transport system, substrate-binding protein [Chloroflexi bacterium]|jgi:TRAP-type mannitol/chloroaromatic compound transport system substrate-binding protein|nr:MAG: TRAP-type C4-dicarboxylate transport system, substrate-binding protein [Chloroflexota bacterium]
MAPTMAPVEAKEIKLIGAWPQGITITDWQEAAMIAKMNELSAGSLDIGRVAGPAEVHQAEQAEAVRQNIYQMVHTASAYFRELTQLPNVEAWVGGAPVATRESCGLEDIFREIYDESIGIYYLGPSAYRSSAHIYLSELANEDRSTVDLTGLKLRGHALYQGGTEALGGSIVNMPSSDVYTGVQRGVIEGSIAGGDWMYARDVKWDEIMNFVYNVNLDNESGHVYVNKSTWLGMTKQQQDAMYNGLVVTFEELEPELAARKAEALATLEERGVEVITPPDAEIARVQGLWLEKNVPSVLTGDPDGPRVLTALQCIWKEVGLVVNL